MPGQRLTKLQCYSERGAGFRLTRLASLSSASYFTLCVMVPLNKPVLQLSTRDMLNGGFCSAPQGDIRANLTPITWHQTNLTRLNHLCRAQYPNRLQPNESLIDLGYPFLKLLVLLDGCNILVVKPVWVTAYGAHHKYEWNMNSYDTKSSPNIWIIKAFNLLQVLQSLFSPVNYCATFSQWKNNHIQSAVLFSC